MKPRLFYDNRFADSMPVASSTAAGNFAAANVADWRPYTWWKPAVLPATLTVDSGVAKDSNYALVWGHDMKSVGASLEVRASTDNFGASDVLLASTTPATDDPFLLTYNLATYRHRRLKFTGATPPTIAIAAAGVTFNFEDGLAAGFDPIGRKINGRANANENGHPLGRVIDFEEWEETCAFDGVSWSWLRSTFLPAWRAHLRSTPFAFQWDADEAPSDLLLVTAGMEFDAPHRNSRVARLSMKLRGVVA